ncbi:Nn.00g014880.m01.CDS01 [Neocucurbitaria sp. VM-36]
MSEPTPQDTPTGDAAVDFINNHTIIDDKVPLLSECPICLENYSKEPCLHIIGIEGCNHQFGLNCLRAILRSHPNEEKKCPLCRTVWIPAAAPLRRRSTSRSRTFTALSSDINGNAESIRIGAGVGRQSTNPAGTRNILRGNMHNDFGLPYAQNQRNTSIQNPILLDSDSDADDYETQLENYQSFSRDIESIRTRARNTQLSRSQRRRELNSHQRNASITADQTGSVSNNSNNNPPARSSPSGGGAATPFSNRPYRPRTAAEFNVLIARMHASPFSSHTPASTAIPTNMDVDEVIEVPKPQTQSSRDAERIRQWNRRETELNDREKRVNERENELQQREQALKERERRANRMLAVMTAQRVEMQNVQRRQREDLERVSH